MISAVGTLEQSCPPGRKEGWLEVVGELINPLTENRKNILSVYRARQQGRALDNDGSTENSPEGRG